MSETPTPETPAAPDPQREQIELLKKINGKLAFFVWLIVIAMVVQFFIFTFSLY